MRDERSIGGWEGQWGMGGVEGDGRGSRRWEGQQVMDKVMWSIA